MTGTYATYGAEADAAIAELEQELAAAQLANARAAWRVGVSAGPTIPGQLTKWGNVPLRFFYGVKPLAPSALPFGGCVSFNPDPAALLSGQLDAQIIAWAKAQTAPTDLAPWHELDAKTRQQQPGIPTAAQQAQIIKYLTTLLAPYFLITVRAIYTAYLLALTGFGNWLNLVPCNHVGFDFDGSRPTAQPYTDYTRNVQQFASLVPKYLSVTVPEFGCQLIGTDLAGQAAWLTTYAQALRGVGAKALYLFDTAPEGPLAVNSPPYSAFKAVIATATN